MGLRITSTVVDVKGELFLFSIREISNRDREIGKLPLNFFQASALIILTLIFMVVTALKLLLHGDLS